MSLTNAITLTEGFQTTLVNSSATGTGNSQYFATQNTAVVNWKSTGTTGASTITLQFSDDGGVTWVNDTNQATIDVNGQSTGTFYCPQASVWRVNVVSVSGTLLLVGTVGS